MTARKITKSGPSRGRGTSDGENGGVKLKIKSTPNLALTESQRGIAMPTTLSLVFVDGF